MGDKTTIEWTDATWTPIRARHHQPGTDAGYDRIGWHCEHVSEGCRNCYAESWNQRLGTRRDYKPAELAANTTVFLDKKTLLAPLLWKKPRRIFVCSMTDLFASFVKDAWIDRIFAVMALYPQHTFQILTKRPERMQDYIRCIEKSIEPLERAAHEIGYTFNWAGYALLPWPIPNVWLGTSVEDQPTANERIPILLHTPAANRFLSCEPLLGPVDLSKLTQTIAPGFFGDCLSWHHRGKDQDDTSYPAINWIIAGGESGLNARPMHPDWPRAVRDQCAAANVPFFFKQWGEWLPCDWDGGDDNGTVCWPDDGSEREMTFQGKRAMKMCGNQMMWRVGKKEAGNHLDGIQHLAFPA